MMLRLDRWLTTLGEASRSRGKELIRAGRVAVNGAPVTDPSLSFETETSVLSLDGRPVDGRVMRHAVLHKPAGVLTAARDPKQPTVMDLLPPVYRAIGCMPVGRLDKDTTGLLFLTCDGELNHRLLSPARHVDKRYRAAVEGTLTAADVEAFASGLDLGDFTALPAPLTILSPLPEGNTLAEVTLTEGKFHQVKRMFEKIGHPVITLHRLSFGPLTLGSDLPEGAWRELTADELSALRRAAGLE